MVHKNFLALLDNWNQPGRTIHGSGLRPAARSIGTDGPVAGDRLHDDSALRAAGAFPLVSQAGFRNGDGAPGRPTSVDPSRRSSTVVPPSPASRPVRRRRSSGVVLGARRAARPDLLPNGARHSATEHERERTRRGGERSMAARQSLLLRVLPGANPVLSSRSWCPLVGNYPIVGHQARLTVFVRGSGPALKTVAQVVVSCTPIATNGPCLDDRDSSVSGLPAVGVQPSLVGAGRRQRAWLGPQEMPRPP